jgi:peptidoglycan/xylan/chitin deacetylase (PgdA/CDA1 family)
MIVPLVKGGLTRARSAAWAARGAPAERAEGLRILLYHRVSGDGDVLAVKPNRFREQMSWLADAGYRALDLEGAYNSLLQSPGVAITFDDGFRDVAEQALPELERHGFSATVFACPAVVDGRASFGWYGRQPPVLGWDELVELDRAGTLRVGAHTLTHPDLRALDEAEARQEIEGSKRELEARLGREVPWFCYPSGLFGEREKRLAAEAGFAGAVSCEPGVNTPETDPFALRRVQIEATDSLLDFRAKLAGAFDEPLPGRAVYRRVRYRASSRS